MASWHGSQTPTPALQLAWKLQPQSVVQFAPVQPSLHPHVSGATHSPLAPQSIVVHSGAQSLPSPDQPGLQVHLSRPLSDEHVALGWQSWAPWTQTSQSRPVQPGPVISSDGSHLHVSGAEHSPCRHFSIQIGRQSALPLPWYPESQKHSDSPGPKTSPGLLAKQDAFLPQPCAPLTHCEQSGPDHAASDGSPSDRWHTQVSGATQSPPKQPWVHTGLHVMPSPV